MLHVNEKLKNAGFGHVAWWFPECSRNYCCQAWQIKTSPEHPAHVSGLISLVLCNKVTVGEAEPPNNVNSLRLPVESPGEGIS